MKNNNPSELKSQDSPTSKKSQNSFVIYLDRSGLVFPNSTYLSINFFNSEYVVLSLLINC